MLPGRLLVAPFRHDLAHGTARRAELDRDHAGVADDLAAERLDLARRGGEIVDLHGEMMDAGALAGGFRFGRLRAFVVLDQREVDRAVREMARGVVAHLLGVGLDEAEYRAVEVRGALEVVDLQREVHDAIHGLSCRSGLSLRTSARRSSRQTASHSLRARVGPITGAIRS